MNPLEPAEFRWERLARNHRRRAFSSGVPAVDEWLQRNALQNQEKSLSMTRVLASSEGRIGGFFTLAMGQVDCNDLPGEIACGLPRRLLPVAVLAWLGVDRSYQGLGLGRMLVGRALRDCQRAGETFAFVGVMLDCLNEAAKSFYGHWDFEELAGNPNRLLLSIEKLKALVHDEESSAS